jgi:hypothetical protein
MHGENPDSKERLEKRAKTENGWNTRQKNSW